MTSTARLLAGLTDAQYRQVLATVKSAAYKAGFNPPPGQGHELYQELEAAGNQWIADNAEQVELLYFNSPAKAQRTVWISLVKHLYAHRKANMQTAA